MKFEALDSRNAVSTYNILNEEELAHDSWIGVGGVLIRTYNGAQEKKVVSGSRPTGEDLGSRRGGSLEVDSSGCLHTWRFDLSLRGRHGLVGSGDIQPHGGGTISAPGALEVA
ncbi:hypothetical protein TIFTF001_054622 [Ficus carica]|uniref:Uncharacterized protein n=1 Tax=Ficus carica TaxID=3494 RepID=A0AA88EBE3_FICCA|nr:hypothetical protein TIFTF001_054622 [Ficus carica]